MDVILKERPHLNLDEFLVFCSCNCSCLRFSLYQEDQSDGTAKFMVYMNVYSCLPDKPPKHCKTEFEMTLGNAEALLNFIEHGWKCKEVKYNSTHSPKWMTALVCETNGAEELTIGLYAKRVGNDEAYRKKECAAEIILERDEYKKFIERLQIMIDTGKKYRAKWEVEHALPRRC